MLRLGTRGSLLARTQSEWVAARLRGRGHDVELVIIETDGDRDVTSAFADIGTFGVFVREIERLLEEDDIDVAVHSYKDMPTKGPADLVVAAVPERRDAADVLVARPEAVDPDADDVLGLVRGARVGTSSARRRAQIASLRPDLRSLPFRGNVTSRVRKLREGGCDATLLAAAGLDRLRDARGIDLDGLVVRRLPPEQFVPAPAQGALAVQVRVAREDVRRAVRTIDDPGLGAPIRAERSLLARVEGGCDLPFGAHARTMDGGDLELFAGLEVDGLFRRVRAAGDDPETVAAEAWERLVPRSVPVREGGRG
jgi:hydroxymethylbilane synthase